MVRVAVAGASGYMGAELLRLLLAHPRVVVTMVTSERLAGQRLDHTYPHLRSLTDLTFTELDPEQLARAAEAVFLALPHMESQTVVPVLRQRGCRVIDLSADYRLRDATEYTTWYKSPHLDPAGLAEAVYGLPELHRKAIGAASLVASPGCYPVGAILATAPLLRRGVGRPELVVDGKSGVTGAGAQGRNADPMYLYTEANENVQAYAIGFHRHTPEMEQELSAVAGQPVRVSFTPHLLPLNRGLFTTASLPLHGAPSTADLRALYDEFYAGEPFVRVARDDGIAPSTRRVVGSNFCDVAVVVDSRAQRAVCVSAIDNLGKGGSANGLQILNIMFGWDERTGLGAPPVYP